MQERATKLHSDESAKLKAELGLWERRLERERTQTEKYKVSKQYMSVCRAYSVTFFLCIIIVSD